MTDAPAPKPIMCPAQRRMSALWILPVIAMVGVVAVVGMQVSKARGLRIEIMFTDAAGLETGAEIVHRGIGVGVVRAVELTPDLSGVLVRAELAPHAAGLARDGTRFWVARPEISLKRVSGLETILGPKSIVALPADEPGERAVVFEGLAGTPPERGGSGDLVLNLSAPSASSLAPGAPVVYRGVRVGSVRSVALAPDGSSVEVVASVAPEHARLVRENTRFWMTGGVGVDFGLFRGLSVQASSLDSLIEGGIGFATPRRFGDPAQPGDSFELESEPEDSWLDWAPSIPPSSPASTKTD